MTYKHKDSLVNLSENGEWKYVSKQIVGIIGSEKYRNAIDRRNAMNDTSMKNKIHLATVLHEQHYFSYKNMQDLIFEIFKEITPTIRKVQASQLTHRLEGDEVTFFLDDEEVIPVWLPKVAGSANQVIVQYQEFFTIQTITSVAIESMETSDKQKEFFTFRDVVFDATGKGTSDVHLIPKEDFYHIFFRINGDLIKQSKYIMPIDNGYEFATQIAIDATNYTKGSFSSDNMLLAQEGRIEFPDMGADGVDIRLEFIPDGVMGKRLTIVARILKRQRIEKANLLDKGYDEKVVRIVGEIVKQSGGLVMISGVTGSGKSTFCADLLTTVNPKRRIYTIEDPIEYFLLGDNITQHQIYLPPQKEGEKSKQMGFSEYTKALKRADPDVVNIGEMRNDPDLVKAIFEMANAGQLIFTTVHIRSAFDIYHALDQVFGISKHNSIPLILFSINLKLSKKLCQKCKVLDENGLNFAKLKSIEPILPYEYKVKLHEFFRREQEFQTYLKGPGCPDCKDGYNGRVPIYEYFRPDVGMIEWMLEKQPSRYQIEQRACNKSEIGENKLNIFIGRLIAGEVDTSDEILQSII